MSKNIENSNNPLHPTISNVEVSNNDVDGSILIGSTLVSIPSFDIGGGAKALKTLIEKHEKLKEDSPEYLFVMEELQSRIRENKSRTIVGLKAKLDSADRNEYYDEALLSSQKASKMIVKFQHIKSYQIIFNHILSLILTRFNSHILPLLKGGGNDIAIKTAINSTIVEPLYQEVALAGGYVTSDLIEGMLYFLTEKCHVTWE